MEGCGSGSRKKFEQLHDSDFAFIYFTLMMYMCICILHITN